MVTLTKEQKEIRARIKASIEHEIGMCDDYADLMILANALYDSSKHICKIYSDHMKSIGSEPADKNLD